MRIWLSILIAGLVLLSTTATALTPIAVSAAGANSLVISSKPARLYQIFAANHTATAGFVLVLNATSAPADGAVTPLWCINIPASGTANVLFTAEGASFSVGITAVLSSGANCLTKTTGTITGYITALLE